MIGSLDRRTLIVVLAGQMEPAKQPSITLTLSQQVFASSTPDLIARKLNVDAYAAARVAEA
jgi:hypothetical protein